MRTTGESGSSSMRGRGLVDAVFYLSAIVTCVCLILISRRLEGNWTAQWIAVAVIAGGVAVALGVCPLLTRPQDRVNLLVAGASTSLAVLMAETVLAMLAPNNAQDYRARAVARGLDLDWRRPCEFVEEQRAHGLRAHLMVGGFRFLSQPLECNGQLLLPLAGISNCLTATCNENGYPFVYKSDKYGFNNPDGVWEGGAVDAVFLGDSFTQGMCVRPDSGFVDRVRRVFPCANLGVGGSGPLLMLAALVEYGHLLEPPLVFWCVFDNDLYDLEIEKQSPLLMGYVDGHRTQDLVTKQPAIDYCLADMETRSWDCRADANSRAIPSFASILKLEAIRERIGLRLPDKVSLALYRDVISLANDIVGRWSGKLVVVRLPGWERFAAHPRPQRIDDVTQIAGNLGIDVVDLEPVLRALGNPLLCFPFEGPGHYTDRGHEVVAERLINYISSIEGR